MTTEEKAKRFLDNWYATGLETKIKHSLFNKEALEKQYGAIMNTWILRSDREPTKEDGLCRLGFYYQTGGWSEYTWDCRRVGAPVNDKEYTHWRSIKAEPPPRQLTQREKDDEMAAEVVRKCCWSGAVAMSIALQALYAERRGVAKLVDEFMQNPTWGRTSAWASVYQRLRARLDEQGE